MRSPASHADGAGGVCCKVDWQTGWTVCVGTQQHLRQTKSPMLKKLVLKAEYAISALTPPPTGGKSISIRGRCHQFDIQTPGSARPHTRQFYDDVRWTHTLPMRVFSNTCRYSCCRAQIRCKYVMLINFCILYS